MHQPATFSDLFSSSFKASKTLFWTYIRGILMLFSAVFVLAVIEVVLLGLLERPAVMLSLGLKITIWTLLALFFIVRIGCHFVLSLFPFILAIDRKKRAVEAIRRTLPFILRSLLLSLWIFLRSFVWVSILGVLCIATQLQQLVLIGWLLIIAGVATSIVLIPRFGFANILQIRDNMSVLQSAEASFRKTKGYWWKIVGNGLLLSLMFFGILLGIVLLGAATGGIIVLAYQSNHTAGVAIGIPLVLMWVCFLLGSTSFFGLLYSLFLVDLFATIEKNPR